MQNNERAKRVTIYTAIAGAMAAGSASAEPLLSPIEFPVEVIDTVAGGQLSAPLDIDGNGVTDFIVMVEYYDNDCGRSGISNNWENGHAVTGSYYAGLVSPGGTISGGGAWTDYAAIHSCTGGGPFNGYAGIRFQIDGNEHFGYLEVETTEQTNVDLGITILKACYESEPDTPIEAGAPCRAPSHAIPVGGAIPLTLGLLTIGAAALRRRRRHAR